MLDRGFAHGSPNEPDINLELADVRGRVPVTAVAAPSRTVLKTSSGSAT